MSTKQSSALSFLPKRFSWITIIFALLTVISFFISTNFNNLQIQPLEMLTSKIAIPTTNTESMGVSLKQDSIRNYPYPLPVNNDVPVSDTREFLKVNYSATMRTRDVKNLTQRVETIVRGYQGRVDQLTESPKYSFISFVVPQSKYYLFRTELEGLVNSRFLTTNISSQNLLPQKQSIEEQQKQAEERLNEFTVARENIVNTHNSAVQSLQGRINTANSKIANLRSQTETPEILAQIQNLNNELNSLRYQLTRENNQYAVQLKSADNNIKYAQDRLKAIETQDQALLDNVETVSGSVSVNWIDIWEIVQLYLPGYSLSMIFAGLTLISFFFDRWRFGTR